AKGAQASDGSFPTAELELGVRRKAVREAVRDGEHFFGRKINAFESHVQPCSLHHWYPLTRPKRRASLLDMFDLQGFPVQSHVLALARPRFTVCPESYGSADSIAIGDALCSNPRPVEYCDRALGRPSVEARNGEIPFFRTAQVALFPEGKRA